MNIRRSQNITAVLKGFRCLFLDWGHVLLRAVSSAHSCTTPCTRMTVQPHTVPTVVGLITDNDETAYREKVGPWLNGVRRTTSHSTLTRSWWWISGDRAENTPPSPSTRHLWSGWPALSSSAFTSLRISHGLLTQMQCWRRHISAYSSWDGWGSLERAPESSDPSTPAL